MKGARTFLALMFGASSLVATASGQDGKECRKTAGKRAQLIN